MTGQKKELDVYMKKTTTAKATRDLPARRGKDRPPQKQEGADPATTRNRGGRRDRRRRERRRHLSSTHVMATIVQWNVDGVNGRGREPRKQI